MESWDSWGVGRRHTAWPRDSGLMSRNASTFSDSKSFIEGMSPVYRQLPSLASYHLHLEESPLTILQKMQAAEAMIAVYNCGVGWIERVDKLERSRDVGSLR